MNKAAVYNEDWAKYEWDIRTSSGVLVDDLVGLAAAYGVGEDEAIAILADSPALAFAPEPLRTQMQEAMSDEEWFAPAAPETPPGGPDAPPFGEDKPEEKPDETEDADEDKPADDKPAPKDDAKPSGGNPFAKGDTEEEKHMQITAGSYVAWPEGKGRVDLVVSAGRVPGVTEDVMGDAGRPAVRVLVYGPDGKPTGVKTALHARDLRRIAPIVAGKSLDDTAGALVTRLAEHEEAVEALGLPDHARVSGRAVKDVYDRGIAGWPGQFATNLTAEEWALGRVDHFLKVAQGDIATKDAAGNDTDLLPTGHPMSDLTPEEADAAEGAGVEAPPLQASLFDDGDVEETPPPPPADGEGGEVELSQEEIDSFLAEIDAVAGPAPE